MPKINEYRTSFQKRRNVHKKNNDRPVGILPGFLRIFERLLSRKLLEFFDDMLSEFQFGFRKVYGTQSCLLLMFEIWKGATDNNKSFGALLT